MGRGLRTCAHRTSFLNSQEPALTVHMCGLQTNAMWAKRPEITRGKRIPTGSRGREGKEEKGGEKEEWGLRTGR